MKLKINFFYQNLIKNFNNLLIRPWAMDGWTDQRKYFESHPRCVYVCTCPMVGCVPCTAHPPNKSKRGSKGFKDDRAMMIAVRRKSGQSCQPPYITMNGRTILRTPPVSQDDQYIIGRDVLSQKSFEEANSSAECNRSVTLLVQNVEDDAVGWLPYLNKWCKG
ncbi:hypothetical protein GQR58_015976 [Nymphon striatum]|nr:hypothetical protein GQR58_015976 [Nymphon striatum]